MNKFGIIGFGKIGKEFLQTFIKYNNNFNLIIYVYNHNEYNELKKFLKDNINYKIYFSVKNFLSNSFEYIYIASPTYTHFNYLKMIDIKTKNLIVEKPLLTDIEKLKYISKNKNYNLIQAQPNIFNFITNDLKNIIRKNDFKKIEIEICIGRKSRFLHEYMKVKNSNKINYKFHTIDEKLEGGALLDLGIYPIALFIYFFGEPLKYQYYKELSLDLKGKLILKKKNIKLVAKLDKTKKFDLFNIKIDDEMICVDSATIPFKYKYKNINCIYRLNKNKMLEQEIKKIIETFSNEEEIFYFENIQCLMIKVLSNLKKRSIYDRCK